MRVVAGTSRTGPVGRQNSDQTQAGGCGCLPPAAPFPEIRRWCPHACWPLLGSALRAPKRLPASWNSRPYSERCDVVAIEIFP